MGIVGNLSALSDFGNGCMAVLKANPEVTVSMSKRPGAAFAVFLVATLLRLFDLWAHVIVPVPRDDYWTPLAQEKEDIKISKGIVGNVSRQSVEDEEMQDVVNPVWLDNRL